MEKNLDEVVLPKHLIMHVDAKRMIAASQDMTELISTDFEPFLWECGILSPIPLTEVRTVL